MSDFVIKDSGVREEYEGGMVRDTAADKTDYSLVMDGPMFERWAVHLTKGAIKYAARNWMKAKGVVEMARFKASAMRHFIQWFRGDEDEDHAAAVFFNINGYEFVRMRLNADNKVEGQPEGISSTNDNSVNLIRAAEYVKGRMRDESNQTGSN